MVADLTLAPGCGDNSHSPALLARHLGCIAANSKKIAWARGCPWRAVLLGQPPMHREPPSPCNSICRIDQRTGWCLGCKRTLAEIADWPMLDAAGKRAVLAKIDRR